MSTNLEVRNIVVGGGIPASSVVAETTYGQASAVGIGTNYARDDHTHGTPILPTKAQVGLGNVDNTSDVNKPISTATQTALDGRSNVGHTHTLANITDVTMTVANLNSLDDGVNSTLHFHNTDRDRANHTGTQLSTTISDFTEASQDATGAMVDTSLIYVDATPLLQRAALTGVITAAAGSNATSLGSFTTAQLNTALSDNDVATGGGTASGANTGNQTLTNSSTATSHTVTLSATGGSIQLVEGANITLTTTGTGADGIVTIASTGGGGGTMTVQDEGITQSTTVTTLNFTGAGVTASGAGATATINISGGGGGSSTKGIAEVDFGAITQETDMAVVTVTDASITATSYPSATMYGLATADHDPDDYVAEGLSAYITNIVAGVSFDIAVHAENLTWGKYKVTYLY